MKDVLGLVLSLCLACNDRWYKCEQQVAGVSWQKHVWVSSCFSLPVLYPCRWESSQTGSGPVHIIGSFDGPEAAPDL